MTFASLRGWIAERAFMEKATDNGDHLTLKYDYFLLYLNTCDVSLFAIYKIAMQFAYVLLPPSSCLLERGAGGQGQ